MYQQDQSRYSREQWRGRRAGKTQHNTVVLRTFGGGRARQARPRPSISGRPPTTTNLTACAGLTKDAFSLQGLRRSSTIAYCPVMTQLLGRTGWIHTHTGRAGFERQFLLSKIDTTGYYCPLCRWRFKLRRHGQGCGTAFR